MVDQVEKVARAIVGTGRRHTLSEARIVARAAIAAYNPNERLREALDGCGGEIAIAIAAAVFSLTPYDKLKGAQRKVIATAANNVIAAIDAALTPPSDLSE